MNIKKKLTVLIMILSIILLNGCKKSETKNNDLKEKSSYLIGYDIGSNFKGQGFEIDSGKLMEGYKQAMKGEKSKYSSEESRKIMGSFQEYNKKKQDENAAKNKKDGQDYLEKNKSNSGVVTLPSGLQYKIITDGKGQTLKLKDSVKINLIGKLIDGKVYDDTYKSNKPYTLTISNVIKGIQEALLLMKVGSKWELYIPSELAYGNMPNKLIPANSTLIMVIEILSIEQPKK